MGQNKNRFFNQKRFSLLLPALLLNNHFGGNDTIFCDGFYQVQTISQPAQAYRHLLCASFNVCELPCQHLTILIQYPYFGVFQVS